MIDYLIIFLATFGAAFVLLAAVGILRMPDLYLRISVTTKAATLGIGLILICVAVYFGKAPIATRALAIIFFLLLTAPVGAHLIGRSSYFVNTPLWKNSVRDDLKGKYSQSTEGSSSEESDGAIDESEREDDKDPTKG
jgi:multicomponent Na+:H+ antiporter subunit G